MIIWFFDDHVNLYMCLIKIKEWLSKRKKEQLEEKKFFCRKEFEQIISNGTYFG